MRISFWTWCLLSLQKYVGIIECGHIYFFHRLKVQLEEAHSIEEVKNFHMLSIPRPPAFAVSQENTSSFKDVNKTDPLLSEEAEMKY